MDVPTLADPSLAPPCKPIVSATTLIPYDVGGSWREQKARYSALMMDELESLLPGLRAHTQTAEGASARTMQRYSVNPTGAIYERGASPDRVGIGRLAPGTSLPQRFLSGHRTPPGRGTHALVVSGTQTSGLVTRDPLDPAAEFLLGAPPRDGASERGRISSKPDRPARGLALPSAAARRDG